MVIDKLNETNELEFSDLSEVMQNTFQYVESFGEFQDTDSITLCKKCAPLTPPHTETHTNT